MEYDYVVFADVILWHAAEEVVEKGGGEDEDEDEGEGARVVVFAR